MADATPIIFDKLSIQDYVESTDITLIKYILQYYIRYERTLKIYIFIKYYIRYVMSESWRLDGVLRFWRLIYIVIAVQGKWFIIVADLIRCVR